VVGTGRHALGLAVCWTTDSHAQVVIISMPTLGLIRLGACVWWDPHAARLIGSHGQGGLISISIMCVVGRWMREC
jgi:hypothetical protein